MAERLAVGQYRNAQRVFHASLYYVLAVGGVGAAVAFFGAPFFLSKQPDAVLALRVLAPTILMSGFLGCLRGYFQAQNNMMPTGISRVVEQIVNRRCGRHDRNRQRCPCRHRVHGLYVHSEKKNVSEAGRVGQIR